MPTQLQIWESNTELMGQSSVTLGLTTTRDCTDKLLRGEGTYVDDFEGLIITWIFVLGKPV